MDPHVGTVHPDRADVVAPARIVRRPVRKPRVRDAAPVRGKDRLPGELGRLIPRPLVGDRRLLSRLQVDDRQIARLPVDVGDSLAVGGGRDDHEVEGRSSRQQPTRLRRRLSSHPVLGERGEGDLGECSLSGIGLTRRQSEGQNGEAEAARSMQSHGAHGKPPDS